MVVDCGEDVAEFCVDSVHDIPDLHAFGLEGPDVNVCTCIGLVKSQTVRRRVSPGFWR